VAEREVVSALRSVAGRFPFHGIKWVAGGPYHFTLKFLGEQDGVHVAAAGRALESAARASARFRVVLRGVGAFPGSGPPRVVWAGCREGKEELTRLASAVEEAFETEGFPPEARPFSPHLTLGRVKDPRAVPGRPFREVLAAESDTLFGALPVDDLVLFRSDLSPAGPTYVPLVRVPLVGRPAAFTPGS